MISQNMMRTTEKENWGQEEENLGHEKGKQLNIFEDKNVNMRKHAIGLWQADGWVWATEGLFLAGSTRFVYSQ